MARNIEWIDRTYTDTIEYEPWRHGGWYWWTSTHDHWPEGGTGCVSRNYVDRKWRIVCDPREGSYPGGPNDYTYSSRKAAALAERELMKAAYERA